MTFFYRNPFVRASLLAALLFAAAALGASQVDINSADAKTLATSLAGVGLVKAEAIVAYRTTHGAFASLDDLAKVDGIGPRIIEENRERIVFGKAPPDPGPRADLQRPMPGGW